MSWIPLGISENSFPECSRSTVSCSTKLAKKIDGPLLRIYIELSLQK
jgi:hypothetical protein